MVSLLMLTCYCDCVELMWTKLIVDNVGMTLTQCPYADIVNMQNIQVEVDIETCSSTVTVLTSRYSSCYVM